jgi:hypothetical protein
LLFGQEMLDQAGWIGGLYYVETFEPETGQKKNCHCASPPEIAVFFRRWPLWESAWFEKEGYISPGSILV